MNLRYITCSDPREFNDIHDIVKLAMISKRVEIAVQAHPSKMSPGMPRNEWFRELLDFVIRDKYDINLAVHVNQEWCDYICRKGKIPFELKEFFASCHNGDCYKPVIARWQLNVPAKTANNMNIRALKQLLNSNLGKKFIIQYNNNTSDVVHSLYRARAQFSVLYDASGGRGISPQSWAEPVFSGRPQGYSGGLSPENIATNLDKISRVANRSIPLYDAHDNIVICYAPRDDIWIDAEGKLKTDNKFDVARARQYILNAENWLQHQKQK